MNYRGSYRKLLGNAKAAMIAAIEIYNKPTFKYRDECVVILLLNAWELVLKAVISMNKKSVYYPKKRNQAYRTLSWQDALTKARNYFPDGVRPLPVKCNLEILGTYRDNAVHFYNARGFGVVLYVLSQTCVKNFRDLLIEVFGTRLEDEINWQLLPLGISPPVDVVDYISGRSGGEKTSAVRQFLSELAAATNELKKRGEDTGRLLTVFNVKLESVKKIGDADVVVEVKKVEGTAGPLAVIKTQDPNITHPLRQIDIAGKKKTPGKIVTLHGKQFTSYVFQAIVWKYGLKENSQYCWRAKEGVLTRYSNDIVTFIKGIPLADIEIAITDYKKHMRSKRKRKNG